MSSQTSSFLLEENVLGFLYAEHGKQDCCGFLDWQLGRASGPLCGGGAGPCQWLPLLPASLLQAPGWNEGSLLAPGPAAGGGPWQGAADRRAREVFSLPDSGVGLLGDVGPVLSVPWRQDGTANADGQRRDCADEKHAVRSYYQFKICKLQAIVFTILFGLSF